MASDKIVESEKAFEINLMIVSEIETVVSVIMRRKVFNLATASEIAEVSENIFPTLFFRDSVIDKAVSVTVLIKTRVAEIKSDKTKAVSEIIFVGNLEFASVKEIGSSSTDNNLSKLLCWL